MSQKTPIDTTARKDGALLSVVVTVVGGGEFLHRCLTHLVRQTAKRPVEIIVPYDPTVVGIPQLAEEFPSVWFAAMGPLETSASPGSKAAELERYDRRIANGLSVANGTVIAIVQDYCIPAENWCQQILDAHELPHEVIGGAVEHAGRGLLNWAVYFQDFGRYQLPLPEGPTTILTDINVSYKAETLQAVRSLWEERYKEVTVNGELMRTGVLLWQRPQIIVRQDRGKLRLKDMIVERYFWGRLLGSIRGRALSPLRRGLYIVLGPAIPFVLLSRAASKIFRGKQHRKHFLLSLPFFLVLTVAWFCGELTGYVTTKES